MGSVIAFVTALWLAFKQVRRAQKAQVEHLEGAIDASERRLQIEQGMRREEGQLRSLEAQSRAKEFVEALENKHAVIESHEKALELLSLTLNTSRSIATESGVNGDARARALLLSLTHQLYRHVSDQDGAPLDVEELQGRWWSGGTPVTPAETFAFDIFELWALSVRALQGTKSATYFPAFFVEEYRRDPSQPMAAVIHAAIELEKRAQGLPALTDEYIPGAPLIGPQK